MSHNISYWKFIIESIVESVKAHIKKPNQLSETTHFKKFRSNTNSNKNFSLVSKSKTDYSIMKNIFPASFARKIDELNDDYLNNSLDSLNKNNIFSEKNDDNISNKNVVYENYLSENMHTNLFYQIVDNEYSESNINYQQLKLQKTNKNETAIIQVEQLVQAMATFEVNSNDDLSSSLPTEQFLIQNNLAAYLG